jgi:LuxR family maltose regulon positive regulatory protein
LASPLLATKLHIPFLRSEIVSRSHLIDQLNAGLSRKLALISAPAGFGKSTLLCAWAQQSQPKVRIAWLSLDEEDNDLTRFLIYFVSALQTIDSNIGSGILALLQSPGMVDTETICLKSKFVEQK